MQANIEISLKTREVFKLFERKIDGDRLFINAILHKFNILTRQCRQKIPNALIDYNQTEQNILALIQQFTDELNRFETVLESRRGFTGTKINFIAQFHTTITVNTLLSIRLIEFIKIYDRFIAVLKLLYISGCFASDSDYYANIRRTQKSANIMLSHAMINR